LNPSDRPSGAQVQRWLVEARLPAAVEENVERLARSDDVHHIVLLPDIHLGRLFNNGCVTATRHLVYPQAVGSDIGCGFSLIGFAARAEVLDLARTGQEMLARLYRAVPALKAAGKSILPERLQQHPLSDPALQRAQERDGAFQLGTLGCGNHFVELQRDDTGRLWLMVHSGSRAMGQKITAHHQQRAARSQVGLFHLDAQTPEGAAYWNDMEWAVRYATLNRLAIMARTVEALEQLFGITPDEDSYLDVPHNFARRERHRGEDWIVHRKSANSARAGEVGLVAGSMGSPSYVVEGLGAETALCSSSHGAGRSMSRTEARRTIHPSALKRQLGEVTHDPRHLDDLLDEAPEAYRNVQEVLRAQRDLVRQRAKLTPVLNFKYPDRREAT